MTLEVVRSGIDADVGREAECVVFGGIACVAVMKAERPSTSMDFLQDPACSHSPTVILCQADAGNVLEIVALLADLRNSPEDVHVAVLTALQDVALITLLHAFGVATIVQLPADRYSTSAFLPEARTWKTLTV